MESDIANNRYTRQILRLGEVLELGKLKVSGNDLMLLCPFHKESNPSFGINTETGLYNCFSCGAKGHISHFLGNLRCNILTERTDRIEDFEVTAKIDTVSYSIKPSGGEVGGIRNRLADVSLNKYTIKQLLGQLTTGHTVSLSGAKTNSEWLGQQVVMIDIDNNYSVNFKELIDFAKEVGVEPSFAYQTYSSTENVCRCRFAYAFKEVITDKQVYSSIANMLIKKLSAYGADKQCADFCRLFYGTMNKDVYIGNLLYSSCRFTSEQLNEVAKIFGKGYRSTKSKKVIADAITGDAETEKADIYDYMEGKKFRHDKLAMDIIKQYNIVRMNHNQLYYYDRGIHVRDLYRDIEQIIAAKFSTLDIARRKEVTEYIAVAPNINKNENNSEFLACKNGILNYRTLEMQDFNSDIILTHKINADYIPFDTSMTNSFVDTFMSQVTENNKDMEILIYESIGASCIKENVHGKCIIFNRFRSEMENQLYLK